MESSESVTMSNSSSLSSIQSGEHDSNTSPEHANTTTSRKNSTYRYTKDFLHKIRHERSKFIDTIYPDIFKAYCYCMNGKFWNPEKYFEVVQYQYPQDFDKIRKHTRSQQHQQKQLQNGRKPHQAQNQSANRQRHHSTQSNISASEADRILLSLIKQKPAQKHENILDKLFAAEKKPLANSVTNNVLDLVAKKAPILTAQELEANLQNTSSSKANAYTKLMDLFNNQQSRQQCVQVNENENLLNKLFPIKSSQSTTSNGFPQQNPHEKPSFQVQQENDITMALNKILKSNSPSPTKSTLSSSSSVDAIFNKLRVTSTNTSPIKAQINNSDNHFNYLLSKISNQQQNDLFSTSTTTPNVLKWFKNLNPSGDAINRLPENAVSLADIEASH